MEDQSTKILLKQVGRTILIFAICFFMRFIFDGFEIAGFPLPYSKLDYWALFIYYLLLEFLPVTLFVIVAVKLVHHSVPKIK